MTTDKFYEYIENNLRGQEHSRDRNVVLNIFKPMMNNGIKFKYKFASECDETLQSFCKKINKEIMEMPGVWAFSTSFDFNNKSSFEIKNADFILTGIEHLVFAVLRSFEDECEEVWIVTEHGEKFLACPWEYQRRCTKNTKRKLEL